MAYGLINSQSWQISSSLPNLIVASSPTPPSAYAADPGLVNTEIGFKNTTGLAHWVWGKRRRKGRRPEDAAATSIFLASDPAVQKRTPSIGKTASPLHPAGMLIGSTPGSAYGVYQKKCAELSMPIMAWVLD